ncbi:MAG: Asd/ArgC dimerization domain-containing protein, partial [Acholeplasmataceae bacterium]
FDDPEKLRYPTTIQAKNRDVMFVGRLRKDLKDPKKVLMFITADNIRKGAATNAVQIMRCMFDESYTM